MLEVSHVWKAYGHQDILCDVSLRLHPGQKVGLVGRNGCGKTTLLKIMAGEEAADKGHVQRVPPSLLIGCLPQGFRASGNASVHEFIFAAGIDDSRRWEVEKVLRGLRFAPAQFEQTVSTLSGGEKTRLALARLLLLKPDVLLLDEPTNHLDIGMMEWLEDWLPAFKGAVLIVSHDRRFLDKTVSQIYELENAKMTAYTGNYSDYANQKDLALRQQEEAYRQQQREIQSIKEFIQHQLRIASRIQAGPKRGRDYYSRVGAKVAKRAEAGRKRLQQVERVDKPRSETYTHLQFGYSHSGQEVIRAEGISKKYGDKQLFTGLNLQIRQGDRLSIIGRNGAGKTTLLRMLLGLEHPDEGTVRLGANVLPGYLAQEHENLNPQSTVLEEVSSVCSGSQSDVRTLLACLLFRGSEAFKRIEQLSEGERVRVALAKLIASGANLLILDEPTNHLDIATRERIEIALENYDGTILFVSHDRYLLDRLAQVSLLLEDGTAILYLGNYSYIQEKRSGRDEVTGDLMLQMETTRLTYELSQANRRNDTATAERLREQLEMLERKRWVQ